MRKTRKGDSKVCGEAGSWILEAGYSVWKDSKVWQRKFTETSGKLKVKKKVKFVEYCILCTVGYYSSESFNNKNCIKVSYLKFIIRN